MGDSCFERLSSSELHQIGGQTPHLGALWLGQNLRVSDLLIAWCPPGETGTLPPSQDVRLHLLWAQVAKDSLSGQPWSHPHQTSRSFLIPLLHPMVSSMHFGSGHMFWIPMVPTRVLHSPFLSVKAWCCNYLCSTLEIASSLHYKSVSNSISVSSTFGLWDINNSNTSKHRESYELWAFHQKNT